MNDVSPIRPTAPTAITAKGAEAQRKSLDAVKTPLPVVPPEKPLQEPTEPADDKSREQPLQDAIGTLNDFVQVVKRDLQFTLDEELGRTVVRVVDSASGDLIRQIPEEVFLELARKVKESGELNLLNATG
jgi:flagellar protein FlaG